MICYISLLTVKFKRFEFRKFSLAKDFKPKVMIINFFFQTIPILGFLK